MKAVNIVLRETTLELIADDTIGVDAGALFCANKKIPMLAAIGDFDSVTTDALELIKQRVQNVIELPIEKDMTDFEAALSLTDGYDVIHVYGAIGCRRDHEYLNVLLCSDDTRIILYDDKHRIQSFTVGEFSFTKGAYTYFSIFPLTDTVVSLNGYKYSLNLQEVDTRSRFLTSNQIIEKRATMTIHQGKVLVVQANE